MALTKISRSLLDTGISDSSDATAITITSDEKIGIGTTSPASQVEINGDGELLRLDGTGGAARSIRFRGLSTSTPAFITVDGSFKLHCEDSGTHMEFHTADTERMRITSSGYVGIGTTSPAAELHIKDTPGLARIRLEGGANAADNFEFGQGTTGVTNGGFEIRDVDAAVTRFVIDSNGNLFAGKTAHDFDAAGVEIFAPTGYMNITRDQGTQLYLHRMNNDGAFVEFWQTNNLEGYIQIASGTVSLQNYSDYRMKKNVSDLGSCIDRVKALRPITFEYNRHAGYTHEGFIAHEVQEVLPQAVQGDKDAVDENGDPVYQSYDKSLLIPLLTKAIQELSAKVEELESKINE